MTLSVIHAPLKRPAIVGMGSASVSRRRISVVRIRGFSSVTAIANYTTRVADTSLSSDQRQEALMFLDHVNPFLLMGSLWLTSKF